MQIHIADFEHMGHCHVQLNGQVRRAIQQMLGLESKALYDFTNIYLGLGFMTVKKLPSFSDAAEKLWTAISIPNRKLLLSNVWCSHCSKAVTIKNFSGTVVAGDLLLSGECAVCHGKVARVVESS